MNTAPALTLRPHILAQLDETRQYDLIVVGGGATGLGIALDAAQRGLSVVLLEAHDFAKGTSSRATKLVHGGVRYLAQGNIGLVREALHERALLLRNAPHLASPLPFVMPAYHCWEAPFYGLGLKTYDLLAGRAGLGPTSFLTAAHVRTLVPGANAEGLKGGVRYWDGQFDDARLAVALARTAVRQGARVVNYCALTDLTYDGGRVSGVICQDAETERTWRLKSKCVVNATGVWVDALRVKDATHFQKEVSSLVAPSQGVHVVVDADFLASDHALLLPRTSDGRVLFAIPWLGKVILGTTDTPRDDIPLEPEALASEVEFILSESAGILTRKPQREDVRSIWVGLRPLVRPSDDSRTTGKISREHTVLVSASGLVTVTGGKWTTYRSMAEDVLDLCAKAQLLPPLPRCATARCRLVGASADTAQRLLSAPPDLRIYGDEAPWLQEIEGHDTPLDVGLTEAMVRFAARYEFARSVEDMLARRSRLLFLDARRAAAVALPVARILQAETGVDPQLEAFLSLAMRYSHVP